MRFVRALLAVVLLPGLFAGILPWVIADYDPLRTNGDGAGIVVLAIGIGIVLACVPAATAGHRGLYRWWLPRL
jgi:hypothetical protein